MNTQPPLTIVTAADTSHFGPVQNLCWLLARFEPDTKVIVWDLGLTADQLKLLNEVPPFALKDFTIRKFDFSKYPAYFSLKDNAGSYAWKPIIVSDAVAEFGGLVLWMDAGNFFYQSPLNAIRFTLAKNGFYSPRLPFDIRHLTHPDTIKLLNADAVADGRMRDACVVGINSDRPEAKALVEKWRAAALNEPVIAPKGSTTRIAHHRDESVLSLLAYQSGLPLEDNWFGICGHCDWMSLPHVKFQVTGKIK